MSASERGIPYLIAAVMATKLWSMAMGLAFMPLLLHFLGPEGFGLIGVFLTFQAAMALFDAGLSTTLNHSFSQLREASADGQRYHDLLRTLEVAIWLLAACAGGAVALLGPQLARYWLRFEALNEESVETSIALMGGVLFFQLPLAFYAGGLFGLDRPLQASLLNALWYTLRFAGGTCLLWTLVPSVEYFFGWNLAVAGGMALLSRITLLKCLPVKNGSVRMHWELLFERGRYAIGLSGISLTSLALNQVDKVLLSNLIPLKEFGYYILAGTAANGLRSLAEPVFNIMFPKLSALAVANDHSARAQTYHRGCRLITLLIVPLGAFLIMFAPEVMLAWTGTPEAASGTWPLLSLLVFGNVMLALMVVPYALQLAHGWTSLSLWTNSLAVLLLVPALVLLVQWFGTLGAASIWAAFNSANLIFGSWLMHRRLLPGELRRWYLGDILKPTMAVVLVLYCCRIALGQLVVGPYSWLTLACVFLTAEATILLSLPEFWPQRKRKPLRDPSLYHGRTAPVGESV